MACLSDLSGCELILLANIVAIGLSQDMNTNEINLLSSFFTLVGDNLAAIAASRAFCDDDAEEDKK